MNKVILNIVVQEFINNNLNSDITSLLLKGISFDGVTTREIIEQIEAKKKCKNKLPAWFNSSNIYFPNIQGMKKHLPTYDEIIRLSK